MGEKTGKERSYFDGGLLQQIGWTILGKLITAITLGICLPWAFTMIYAWEAKHTVIEGRRLTFDGKAIELFGNVYNYRDKSGLEADAVIHLNDGRWGLIEIKLSGETLINEGALALTKLKEVINQDKMNKPAFLAIITATDSFAYQREDGIYVIPIACLKP